MEMSKGSLDSKSQLQFWPDTCPARIEVLAPNSFNFQNVLDTNPALFAKDATPFNSFRPGARPSFSRESENKG